MIELIATLPDINTAAIEFFKIKSSYESYPKETLIWRQTEGGLISLLDGNMVIYNAECNEELRDFIKFVSPASVFSSLHTISALFWENIEAACVMEYSGEPLCDSFSDELRSDEIYKLLDIEGFELPNYECFAVDFCHRLRTGALKYFAKRDLSAAIALISGNTALINGIASHKKGEGSRALRSLIAGLEGKRVFALCREPLKQFYIKNGFSFKYHTAYWRK